MNSIFKILRSMLVGVFLLNCSGEDKETIHQDRLSTDPPGTATLVFPPDNSDCLVSSDVSGNEMEIKFDWNDAENTNSYQLFVKNLITQVTESHTTTDSNKLVKVLKNTPYSWYVISMNNTNHTSASGAWNFRTAANPVSSFSPYPAEAIFPTSFNRLDSGTNTVLLEWSTEGQIPEIKEYDVFFDVVSPPGFMATVTGSSSLSVQVSSGNIYYWRVVTKDHFENSSESQIFQFSVE